MLKVGLTRFSQAPGMGVKGADDFLAENLGCGNDPPDIETRKHEAPRATTGIARSHKTKVTASGNNQSANLLAVAFLRAIARLAKDASVLGSVECVHCREDT
jgi:hypothetical protein